MDLKCLQCVVERKVAEMNGEMNLRGLWEVPEAITMIGGQAVCYEHLVVQRQSPLAVPGQPAIPPGLMNGHS